MHYYSILFDDIWKKDTASSIVHCLHNCQVRFIAVKVSNSTNNTVEFFKLKKAVK